MVVFLIFEENQEAGRVRYIRTCSSSERAEWVVSEMRLEAASTLKEGSYPNLYWWQAEEVEES